MNFEEKKGDEEMEKIPETASDMELVLFLIKHIENPCEIEVEEGRKENIRSFYLREARRVLEKITNESAKKLLEEKIKEYEDE